MSGRILLDFAVPSTSTYETSARELTPKELADASEWYNISRNALGADIPEENPITLRGLDKKLKVFPGDNADLPPPQIFRSGFYNSEGYSLEQKTGVFSAQGGFHRSRADAQEWQKVFNTGYEGRYLVGLSRGNTSAAVMMVSLKAQPTKELGELVNYAVANGFTAKTVDRSGK